jgi:vacuolar-type H+-ATPase subunit C/Vma6
MNNIPHIVDTGGSVIKMTANEIADKLDMVRIGLTLEAATMLRQQQAEIEALHKLIKEQDMKIINLSFDLAYANRTIELANKESE